MTYYGYKSTGDVQSIRWPWPLSGWFTSIWRSSSVLSVRLWCLFLFICILRFIHELFWISALCIWNQINNDRLTRDCKLWESRKGCPTCDNGNGIVCRRILTSDGARPCSINSVCSLSLWTPCCSSEMSMLTGWKYPGHVCATLMSENDVAPPSWDPVWLSLLWFGISDWVLNVGLLTVCNGLISAEAGVRLGVRKLAHSCPLLISSSRLKEPRPNSKSLSQEKRGTHLESSK